MKRNTRHHPWYQRLLSFGLAAVLAFGAVPLNIRAAVTTEEYTQDPIDTVADDQTIGRPNSIYGNNTLNAGKVTVGKSVHNGAVTITYGSGKTQTFTPAQDNFIITSSQASQVVGLASESAAPVDVVFVLDTSSSMSNEVEDLVEAANNAIEMLMKANPDNRVGVVAFSGTSGGGTSGGAAANVLSPLAHYDGEGETAHLTLRDGYMYGRGTKGNTRLNRDATSSGTNIQSGIVAGARELMNATDVTVNGVTRIPFLVVMSDGEPSYAVSGENWYEPSDLTRQMGRQYPAAGLGFLPTLTAAYYKAKITEKYFGTNAGKDNRCFIYTLGLGLESISHADLALMTVDPAGQTASNSSYSTFERYWDNGRSDSYVGGSNFKIATGSGDYTVTAASITATKNAVNGLSASGASLGYTGGYKYNDDYFSASQGSELNSAFGDIVTTIQLQAISSLTRVEEAHGADFSGYVTYTDPIGEYMEVKQVFGVVADGNYYQGKSFAQNMQNWSSGASQEFKDHFLKVLKERCKVTGASLTDAQLLAIIEKAVASDNQLYYNSDTDYNNSFVWWGKSYLAEGEEDLQLQILDFAEDDSVEYITDPNTVIPEGADYVCRSYYFLGAAGGTATNPNNEYLHFVVRVQRSLKAPYQETVVISAPASLLSMEKVLITEKTDAQGNKTYTAAVTEVDPARVVYEVGLRSDINAFNVDQILKQDAQAAVGAYDYTAETTVNGGQTVNVNYDAAKGEYYFYTNDWDRTQSESSHHRAMSHATFDASPDNSFYTYTADTPIYTKNGNTYTLYNGTAKPVGEYYYVREYYDWTGATATNNTYTATKKTAYILVDIPSDSQAVKKGSGSWYIAKGAYKASELSSAVEDVVKDPNRTGTSTIVAHPHRTTDENNSHYTVLLGNNGKLTLKRADTKQVDITKPDRTDYNGTTVAGTTIRDADGKVVMVGDLLTYTVKVINGGTTEASAVATDKIPAGTEYVAGSASEGGVYDSATNTITWNIDKIPAGHFVAVSFQVRVTEAALTGDLDVVTIDNAAVVTLSNDFAYTTNTTSNPPEGKKVVDTNGNSFVDANGDPISVEIPGVLVYRIRWYNDSDTVADVVITDKIPAGTTYHDDSARPAATKVENGVITWVIEDAQPGASGVVSFRVNVNAGLLTDQSGERYVENNATITVNNEYRITNRPRVTVETGDLTLTKTVSGYPSSVAGKTFTLHLHEIGDDLDGTYVMEKNGVADTVTFRAGHATVEIQDGETLKILDIPAGAIISVTEAPLQGFTPAYTVNNANASSATEGRVTIVKGTGASVAIENTYSPEPARLQLTAQKTLSTGVDVGNITFGFTAYPCNAAGQITAGAAPLTGEVTVSGTNKTAQVVFGMENYTAAGDYYYLISEINGGVTGVIYAETQYLVHVAVADNGSGILEASVADVSLKTASGFDAVTNNQITFTNQYAPLDTQLTLEATKVLNGRDLKAGEFSFVVTEEVNGSAVVVTTGTNDAAGKIVFRPITYSAVTPANQPHVYTVTEVNGGLKGVDYDTNSFQISVAVADNNGQLVATATYPNGGVTFTNTFTPDEVSVTLTGTKTLTGRDLAAGEFDFVVTETVDGVEHTVATGTNDASGVITFTAIGYTFADVGVHTYTVREVKPDLTADPNMYYDSQSYRVTVTVSYQSALGKLSVSTPVIENATQMVFSNIQNPAYVDVQIVGTKVTNSAPTADLSFSFSVVDAKTGNLASGGSAPANGAIAFTNLSYTTTGEHYYWIYESNHAGETAHGITYSGARYLLKVVVTRDSTNKLVATPTYYYADTVAETGKTYLEYANGTAIDDPAVDVNFTNTYAAKGSATVTATKTLDRKTLVAGDFLFALDRVDAGGNVLSTMYASNTDTGAIAFPSIIVDNTELPSNGTATLRFVMREVVTDDNRLPGVTYSNAVYYLTVTFTDDGQGSINHVIKYYTDDTYSVEATSQSAVFANSYAPVEGTSATIEATKTLSGRPLKAGEFGFELYHVTDAGEHLVAGATNAADGKISFQRNYPATLPAGEYLYVLREINSGLGGVSYSGAQYWIKVTVTDNTATGKLECSVAYYSDAACTQQVTKEQVVFANAYTAQSTTFTPTATKVLNNRTLGDQEFAFVVEDALGNTVSTGLNNADGSITFTPIGYSAPTAANAPHVYKIREVVGHLTGVAYSNAVFYLQVTVTDNQDGTMTAAGAYFTDETCTQPANGATFVNTYTPQSVSLQLQAKKVMIDHAMRNGSFSFLVRDLTASGNPVVATGGNVAAAVGVEADIVFSDIGYTYAMLGGNTFREFRYEITEQPTTHGGVQIDTTVYYAKVTLTYDPGTGNLSTSTAYFTDAACTQSINASYPVFTNVYDPADATLVIPTDKTLVNKVLEEKEFLFTVTDAQGNAVLTAVNDATGHVPFGTLTFDKEGTYTYFVSEKVNTAEGFDATCYTLDNTVKVVVTVTDDERGQLHATAQYYAVDASGNAGTEDLGGVEFINHYTAPALTVPLNTEINATKTVKTPTGVTYSSADFRFAVTDVSGNVIKGYDDGGNAVDMIGVSGADGKVTFPKFRFDKAGEYHYWITEIPGSEAGMTYDARTWEVHILVRYNETTGLLYVQDADVKTYLIGRAASEAADPTFVNVFEPQPVSLSITVDKELDGRELKDREFLFYLMEGERIVAQAHNDVSGQVKFDLSYTAADMGIHAYTVKEVIPDGADNGVTYDTVARAVPTITISYDAVNRKLVAQANSTSVADGAVVNSGETFYNSYAAEGTSVQINAHKVITANRVLKDGEYIFGLKDSQGKVVATAKNDAAGWITFNLTYDEAGIYTYEMLEQPGEDPSIRYDTKRHKVTVTVTDDLYGQLHAVVEYEDGVVPTFVNEYKAVPAATVINAMKTLRGNKTLAAGDFTFELEREDGVKVTTKNAAGGLITFGMRYDAAGVYTYTLREIAGDAPGMTYDTAEYKVVVTVTDNLEGALVAEVTYEGLTNGQVPNFVNSYQGKAAAVQITAAKKLTGKALTADAFSFTLTNKDNTKDVYTVKNDDKGNVVFDLNLTEVGTYTYILAEAAGTDANITYDKATYTVTVKVTDDLQGNLKAEVTYGTDDGKAPTFENIYTPSPITVELTGKKTLKGRELKADEFSFQVTDASGKVVATAKNNAKGELKFSGITVTEAGKYTFTVTEVKGSVKGMIYDDAKYTVTVEVTNENGVLKATVTEPEGGLVFANTYKTPDPTNPGTGDDMPLLLIGLMVVSGGAVVALLTQRKKRRA